jgi:cytochrome c oxidase subunit 2
MPTLQSVLDPAGIQAAHIESLWWLMWWVTVSVFVGVLVTLAIAVRRAPAPRPLASNERGLMRGVVLATAATLVVLIVVLAASVRTGRALQALDVSDAIDVTMAGNQWWWAVEYAHPDPSQRVRTANELHVPVGRPVVINLVANDVIHSLWIPDLDGKMDLIPGRQNQMRLRADRAGVYRGQCAEFCGLAHARMALTVVAEPPAQFDAWLAAQRQLPPPPTSPQAIRGKAVVESGSCALCHTVMGTIAGARTAPDLTHVASRQTLAAGTLANTPDNLRAWLRDPQHPKPGNKMPPPGLSPDDLDAVVAYLETLR